MAFADLQLCNTAFDGNQDGLGKIAHPQLAKNIVDVKLHGTLADPVINLYLLVESPVLQELPFDSANPAGF
jgi:hypothetical protein